MTDAQTARAVLRVDDKWSIEYEPANNDRPVRVLRYGEPAAFDGAVDWKNDARAMFYALLARDAALAAKDAELAVLRAELNDCASEIHELRAQLAEARKALEPFAWIGQWLFARDLPDETPVVMVEGAGKPFALTRGMFKVAHTAARRVLEAQGGE